VWQICQANVQYSIAQFHTTPQWMVSVLGEMLDSISDLEWLSEVRNGSDTVLLPLGENGTATIFTLTTNKVQQ
jgi:hypothetical protein